MYRSQVNNHGLSKADACCGKRLMLLRSCARLWRNSLIATLMFLAAASAPLHADVGRAGAVFMREGFDPRAKALGEAYVGVADDAYSMFYNVSGLSRIKEQQITTAYFKGLADSNTQFVGYARPMGAYQSLGIGLARFTAGTIDIYTPSAPVESRNAEEDWLLSLGYGTVVRSPWRGQWHLGAGIKLFKSTLAEEVRGNAAALDLGGLWTNPRFSFGLSLSNLGPGIGYKGGIATGYKDPLPATLRLGGSALMPLVSSSNRWLITAELSRVFLEKTTFALGTELLYRNAVALRLGYRTGQDIGSFSVGTGFQWGGFRLDYSLGIMQAINHQQAISIAHFFGPGRSRAEEAPGAETEPAAPAVPAVSTAPAATPEIDTGIAALAAYLATHSKASETELLNSILDKLHQVDKADKKRITGIAELCQEVLKLDPGNPAALVYMGTTWYLLGDHAEALNAWGQAWKSAETPAQRGELQRAVSATQEIRSSVVPMTPAPAVASAPSPMAERLEVILDKLRRVSKADRKGITGIIELCQEVLKLEPENPTAQVYMGTAWYLLGDNTEALKEWARAWKSAGTPAQREEFDRAVNATQEIRSNAAPGMPPLTAPQ